MNSLLCLFQSWFYAKVGKVLRVSKSRPCSDLLVAFQRHVTETLLGIEFSPETVSIDSVREGGKYPFWQRIAIQAVINVQESFLQEMAIHIRSSREAMRLDKDIDPSRTHVLLMENVTFASNSDECLAIEIKVTKTINWLAIMIWLLINSVICYSQNGDSLNQPQGGNYAGFVRTSCWSHPPIIQVASFVRYNCSPDLENRWLIR